MTTAVRKLYNATVTCPFCSGTGHLPHYRHIQNGDCFACGASGQLRDLHAFIGDNSDMVLTVWVNSKTRTFCGAHLRRRTWTMSECSVGSGANQTTGLHRSWGRDSFSRTIDDADEAREIWRNAKQLGIITELMD
jgi:Zn ribbon nucleic-acid-binding protein